MHLLSPTHCLVARALMEANTILASHAVRRSKEGQGGADVASFLLMAAQKGIAAARTMERMAAGCGACCNAWPALMRHVSKYRMCMKILYGDEDQNMMQIVSLVQQTNDLDAQYCENIDCGR